MYKYIVAAAALIGLAHPAHADEISNRDQLMAYLKEQMPDGQEISSTFNVDGKLSAGQNHGGCMTARTLAQLDLIARVMIQESLMRVMVTREDTGYQVIGNTKPACEYEIVQFDLYKLSKLGIETPPGDGPAKSVTIPLFEQKVLGVTDVDTKGYVSMGMQGTTCDVSFTPWFGNSKPSRFALYYKGTVCGSASSPLPMNKNLRAGLLDRRLPCDWLTVFKKPQATTRPPVFRARFCLRPRQQMLRLLGMPLYGPLPAVHSVGSV